MSEEERLVDYKVKFEVEGYQCLRCGHKWVPRVMTDREPIICPKCKSPYWNKPRRDDIKTWAAEDKKLQEEGKRLAKKK